MKYVNIAVGLTLTCAFSGPLLLRGQSQPAETPRPNASSWMRVPTSYLAHDQGVSSEIRLARDRYWDVPPYKSEQPLIPGAPEAMASEGSWGEDAVLRPEIPDVPDRAVLIGTFISAKSVLAPSRSLIYTDVSFRVGRMFETGRQLQPGSLITVSVWGGTVALSSGRAVSYLAHPREMFIQPNHTYLLVLKLHQAGDFYTLVDNWDITDGIVRPNTWLDRLKAKTGHSSLSGLKVEELGRALSPLINVVRQ